MELSSNTLAKCRVKPLRQCTKGCSRQDLNLCLILRRDVLLHSTTRTWRWETDSNPQDLSVLQFSRLLHTPNVSPTMAFPTGFEPILRASKARVLSVTLREHVPRLPPVLCCYGNAHFRHRHGWGVIWELNPCLLLHRETCRNHYTNNTMLADYLRLQLP